MTHPAASSVRRRSWSNSMVSLAVCDAVGTVRLRGGFATFGVPLDLDNFSEADLAVSRDLELLGRATMADVTGDGHAEAFVPLMCTNGGGTASGQTAFGIEVFDGHFEGKLLGILRPTQHGSAAASAAHVPYMDRDSIRVDGNRVRATELWYTGADGTCCPSLRVQTVWRYGRRGFQHEASTRPRSARGTR